MTKCAELQIREHYHSYRVSEHRLQLSFLGADSFSFAPQGRLQGVDDDDEEEDSFVWRAVMLLKDCGKAWRSCRCIALA